MSNPPQTPPSSPQGSSLPAQSSAPSPVSTGRQIDFNIGEEYGTARKNMPPIRIVAIALAIVIAIVAAYALTHRAHPLSSGSIDDVVATQLPSQVLTMVAVNVSLHNNEKKPAWIKTIQVTTDINGTRHADDAAPAVDAQEYFASLPALKQHALPILTPEAQINPGQKITGTIVVSFPVTADDFAKRKSLTVTITPYNEVPIVLTK
jgi:hypothetical protein